MPKFHTTIEMKKQKNQRYRRGYYNRDEKSTRYYFFHVHIIVAVFMHAE